MSAANGESDAVVLADLAHLADELAEAITSGDAASAREAHDAIGQKLARAREVRTVVIDIAARRARRGSARGQAL